MRDGNTEFAGHVIETCHLTSRAVIRFEDGKSPEVGDMFVGADIVARMLHALEMVRDADEDCKDDGLPTIPQHARAAIDAAIFAALRHAPYVAKIEPAAYN